MKRSTVVFLSIFIFFLGLYYFITAPRSYESFVSGTKNCPDKLVRKGKRFYLYNTKLAEVPGVNPIVFDHLEDYTEYIEWERHYGRRCKVLYLEEGIDTQGNPVYMERPGIDDTTLLLDAGRDDPPYNTNSYPGFDPENQYVGEETPLDNMIKPTLVNPDPIPGMLE